VDVQKDVPLKDHTTLKVGGSARHFVVAKTKEEMIDAHRFAIEEGLPIFFLGYGSNVLVSDGGFDGLVVKVETEEISYENNRIYADAGVLMSDLLTYSIGLGLDGLQWAAGLPGTTAAAVYGNSGCNDGCMADVVDMVWYHNYHNGSGEVNEKLSKKDFGYRMSKFKNSPVMITGIRLKKLPKARDPHKTIDQVNEFNRRRSESQPKGTTAGCIFKNPTLSDGKIISAGLVIELAGYKEVCFPARILNGPHAEVSKDHGNFFLNIGGAKAFHFKTLITTAKAHVRNMSEEIIKELNKRDSKKKDGKKRDTNQIIKLEEEITYLGNFDFCDKIETVGNEQESRRRDNVRGCSTF
jgi:UDP-N-acetylmuramate dehydrogenase